MNEFTALETIYAPGTSVAGYQRGDAVSADVVANWDLGETQVCEGDLPETPAPAVGEAEKPDEAATRSQWETWAVANGMDAEEAGSVSMDELQAYDPTGPSNPDRPADSANKATWIAYVVGLGADSAWANDGGTTKSDLQAWKVGDPVALAATEANQAS